MVDFNQLVPWALMNFSLAMAMVAIFIAILSMIVNIFTRKKTGFEIIYAWMSLLALGATCIYAFVMHGFFPEAAATAIGWQTSPFQFEVAVANLGFGLIGIFAFCASYGFRVANVIGATCWLWGDAGGHIYQMVMKHDYAFGNSGSWFWMDILIPAILIICLLKMRNRVEPKAKYKPEPVRKVEPEFVKNDS